MRWERLHDSIFSQHHRLCGGGCFSRSFHWPCENASTRSNNFGDCPSPLYGCCLLSSVCQKAIKHPFPPFRDESFSKEVSLLSRVITLLPNKNTPVFEPWLICPSCLFITKLFMELIIERGDLIFKKDEEKLVFRFSPDSVSPIKILIPFETF